MGTTEHDSLEIRSAQTHELDAIVAFYYQLIDDLADKEESPRWEKEVWPTTEMLAEAIEAKTLTLAWEGSELVGAFILDRECPEGYEQAPWSIPSEQALTAHLVAVSTRHQGKGIGRALMQAAAESARTQGAKAIHLDVIDGNHPASELYLRTGFNWVKRVQLFYEDTGWETFDLYELVL